MSNYYKSIILSGKFYYEPSVF